MSVSTNDLKNGMTLDLDGTLFQVIEFQHVKPGKGGAFVRTKLRNVKTGAVIERKQVTRRNAGALREASITPCRDRLSDPLFHDRYSLPDAGAVGKHLGEVGCTVRACATAGDQRNDGADGR